MEKDKVYFISDIHLGARYVSDPRRHEQIVVQMLDGIATDAKHVYLLGDILDYWFEYRYVVPRGYIRFFGALARLADSGVKITWLIGNHDIWLFDYLRDEIGIEIIDGPVVRQINGKKFYLAHGDALGTHLKKSFRLLRAVFRNRFCQKLYSGIHPRWTIPFALRWSSGSRKSHDGCYGAWRGNDLEPAYKFAQEYLQQVDPAINYFVLGHRHVIVDEPLTPDCRLVVLGECYSMFSYAVWDGENFGIKQFDT